MRSGMAYLVDEVSRMCAVTSAELADYLTPAVIETALDRNRDDIYRAPMLPVEEYEGGSVVWRTHVSGYANLEGGTVEFMVRDATGNLISPSLYSADYARGMVTFAANTGGTVYYLTGHTYDLDGAAADIWQDKMSRAAKFFDYSGDGHNIGKSKVFAQAQAMAAYYGARRRMNLTGGLSRSDSMIGGGHDAD